MEKKGICEEMISHKDGNLYIETEDFEEACELRSVMLNYHHCKLISHPTKPLPILEVFDVMGQAV